MLLIFFVPFCAAHHTVTKENVAETQIVCQEGNILKTIKFMLFFLSFAHLKAGYVFFFVFCCFTTSRILNLIVALTSSASQNKQFHQFFSLFSFTEKNQKSQDHYNHSTSEVAKERDQVIKTNASCLLNV